MNMRLTIQVFLLGVLGATGLNAQSNNCQFRGAPDALAERPSPLDSVAVELGGAAAKLCYGRPSTGGRAMIGGVVPFGTLWRFGANEPTTLHLPFATDLGGVYLGPGSYSLYAVPADGPWTIIVNGNTSRWGIPIGPDVRQSDLGSFEVDPSQMSAHVETLTFSFEADGSSGTIIYAWENTSLRIPITRR